jgi:hypothetical protein
MWGAVGPQKGGKDPRKFQKIVILRPVIACMLVDVFLFFSEEESSVFFKGDVAEHPAYFKTVPMGINVEQLGGVFLGCISPA